MLSPNCPSYILDAILYMQWDALFNQTIFRTLDESETRCVADLPHQNRGRESRRVVTHVCWQQKMYNTFVRNFWFYIFFSGQSHLIRHFRWQHHLMIFVCVCINAFTNGMRLRTMRDPCSLTVTLTLCGPLEKKMQVHNLTNIFSKKNEQPGKNVVSGRLAVGH